jgi:hypothetical protein
LKPLYVSPIESVSGSVLAMSGAFVLWLVASPLPPQIRKALFIPMDKITGGFGGGIG